MALHYLRGICAKLQGIALVALFGLHGAAASAQTLDPVEEAKMWGDMAHYGMCVSYGCGPNGASGPRIGYDPCYLAQNAMRPCSSVQGQASRPTGVDSHLVGTWELPLKGRVWVLEIRQDGMYQFQGEVGGSTQTAKGQFAAGEGRWWMKTAAGYTDGGDYLFQAPDIWIATGKQGAAAWRRASSLKHALPGCAAAQKQAPKAGSVDPDLIGTWELPLKGGPWVWEILRDGTYQFHSEAGDGAPAHAGRFSGSDWHWSLTATNGYADSGLYLYQAPDILIATGHLGTAAWRRPSSAASCNDRPVK
jgi:hypothetical protein